MKKIIIGLIGLLLFGGCEKESDTVSVEYRAVNGYSETEITWRNGDEQLVTENFNFESVEDEWHQFFDADRGDIVYLTGLYHDSASSVKLQILIDGKVYKEKTSINDPDKYVIVSGTVPY